VRKAQRELRICGWLILRVRTFLRADLGADFFLAMMIASGLEGHRHLIKSVEYWIDVGKAMNILYLKAERIGRKAFVALQLQEGFVTREGKPIDKGLISKARQMANHEDAVKAWKATLTPKQQDTWNNPNSVFSHCPLFAPHRKSHPSRQTRQMSATPKTEQQLRAQASLKPSPEQIAKVTAEAEGRALETKAARTSTESESDTSSDIDHAIDIILKEPLPLAEAKKFAEAHYAEEGDT
jgi:hypothetical protein